MESRISFRIWIFQRLMFVKQLLNLVWDCSRKACIGKWGHENKIFPLRLHQNIMYCLSVLHRKRTHYANLNYYLEAFSSQRPPQKAWPLSFTVIASLVVLTLFIWSRAASILSCANLMLFLSSWWLGVTLCRRLSNKGYLVTLCTGTYDKKG